jgi:hypothetical protein
LKLEAPNPKLGSKPGSNSQAHALCLSLLACGVLALASGCGTTPVPKGLDNEHVVVGSLKAVNPLDIVVLPIQNNTGIANLPLDRMRRDFHAGLVRLRYSPLALDYVDARTVEAAYTPGDLHEQGILQVFLSGWDDRNWRTRSRLSIDAEVYLLDPRQPDIRRPLWGGKVPRTVDMTQERAAYTTDEALLGRAIDRFVEDVLASLPPRNPELAAAK